MELSTFGAVVAFAVELEERAARFYREAAEDPRSAPFREEFLALARQGESRSRMLSAVRREHVTEMLLEPVVGLRRGDYEPAGPVPPPGCGRALEYAVEMEERGERFYRDAVARAGHVLAGVAGTFRRLAREKGERARELRRRLSNQQ